MFQSRPGPARHTLENAEKSMSLRVIRLVLKQRPANSDRRSVLSRPKMGFGPLQRLSR
jgi:hypothetical protein